MANINVPVFSGVEPGLERDHLPDSVEIYKPHRVVNSVGTLSRLSKVSVMAFQSDVARPVSMVQVPQFKGLAGGIVTDLLVGGFTHLAVRKVRKES